MTIKVREDESQAQVREIMRFEHLQKKRPMAAFLVKVSLIVLDQLHPWTFLQQFK